METTTQAPPIQGPPTQRLINTAQLITTMLKGESEGKSLLDAMRDGSNEGMQFFDGEIEKLVRNGTIDMDTAMAFATNAGNLRLELADFVEGRPQESAAVRDDKATEIEIER